MTDPKADERPALKDLEERWTPMQPVLFRQLSSHGNYRFIERLFDEDKMEFVNETVKSMVDMAGIEVIVLAVPDQPSEKVIAETFGMLDMMAPPVLHSGVMS